MSRVQAAVLCDQAASSSTPIIFLKEMWTKKEDTKGGKDTPWHKWMDLNWNNSFINRMQIPLLCKKSGAILLVLVGLTGGSPTGSQTKYW